MFFVWSYAVKIRGGYLRFQAQYLRRIRVPTPESLAAGLTKIKKAFRTRDFAVLDELSLHGLWLSSKRGTTFLMRNVGADRSGHGTPETFPEDWKSILDGDPVPADRSGHG